MHAATRTRNALQGQRAREWLTAHSLARVLRGMRNAGLDRIIDMQPVSVFGGDFRFATYKSPREEQSRFWKFYERCLLYIRAATHMKKHVESGKI